jgi:hypothetical protein
MWCISYFRFNRYCGLQVETDPWPDMDPHSSLFHFYAHVGRRRRISIWRRKGSYAQTEVITVRLVKPFLVVLPQSDGVMELL